MNGMNLKQTGRQYQRGVTLIELMVALVVGSILIIGAISVFSNSRNTYRVNEIMSRLQENARFALDTVEPDVRAGGYWGLNNRYTIMDGAATVADPVPVGMAVAGDCQNNFSIDLDNPVVGANNGFPFAGCPAFGAGTVPGSDVLVVRHATTDPRPLAAGRIQVQSDRGKAAVFANGILPPGFVATESQTHDLIVHAYYLSRDSVLGAGIPSLRRKRLGAGPAMLDEEVIPWVQDFQVQFGVDTDGDGAANQYVNAGNEPAGSVTVAVRLWLLFRADQLDVGHSDATNYVYADRNIAPPNDAFRRLLVSKTIQLRNTRI